MKKFIFTFLYAIGATHIAAWWKRKQVTILCYHGVTERASRSPRDPQGLHVRQDRFAAHLDYLQCHYHVISLEEYLSARSEKRPLPSYSVIITFDDGYRNFLTSAAPRLVERNMPASMFLIIDRMRENGSANLSESWAPSDDEVCLSWAEAGALEKQGFEFGSHTCSHQKLTTLSPANAERELRDSRDLIAEYLKRESPSLAYPYGMYTDALSARACSLGYICALTTDGGANTMTTDLFKLRRTLIGDDDEKASFAARVSGLAWQISRVQSIFR